MASFEELNEDWVKPGFFDFWKADYSGQVEGFGDMWPWVHLPPTDEELEAIQHFTHLPAWEAAPEKLRQETAEFITEYSGSVINPGDVPVGDVAKMLGHDDASVRKAAAAELERRVSG